MSTFEFIFFQHFRLACVASVLFFFGGILSLPVLKWGPAFCKRLPLLLLRMVKVLMGQQPGRLRMGLVIFCFNGTAMFVYMATGMRPELPGIISVLTGFNITAILVLAGREMDEGITRMSSNSGWAPGRLLTVLCGAAVLVIELPCFWYSIAMGMSLGQGISLGEWNYGQGLDVRADAYVTLILPSLFVSAVCEVVAIQGLGRETGQS